MDNKNTINKLEQNYERRIFKSELEELYLLTLNSGNNNIHIWIF